MRVSRPLVERGDAQQNGSQRTAVAFVPQAFAFFWLSPAFAPHDPNLLLSSDVSLRVALSSPTYHTDETHRRITLTKQPSHPRNHSTNLASYFLSVVAITHTLLASGDISHCTLVRDLAALITAIAPRTHFIITSCVMLFHSMPNRQ